MKVAIALSLWSTTASADPIRLRADALTTTDTPAGLVTVEADARQGPDLSAEAVVWIGAGTIGDMGHADVLVMALRARTLDGRLTGRFGRFVESLGALRPVQVDGAAGRVRLPHRIDVEVYGGVPVLAVTPASAGPDIEPFASVTQTRAWDWVVGGRVARQLGDSGSIGIAYAEQREDGRLASEEIGIDGGTSINKRDDLAAKLAYDLANPGVAQASIIASRRYNKVRVDLYSSYLAASHLLPATSLFSVLGDVPAERAGTTLTWRVAPRLDVGGDLGVRHADDDTAPEIVVRAKLRLDDRGTSALSGELRRDGVGDDQWTGARGVARIALPYSLTASTELELVIADHDRGLGVVWPWALVAIAWDNATWHAAIAGEASASPQDRRRVDVLAQLGWRWGKL
jgi:hypothetical protein